MRTAKDPQRGRIDTNVDDDNGVYPIECAVDSFDLDTFALLYKYTDRKLFYLTVEEQESKQGDMELRTFELDREGEFLELILVDGIC